MRFLKKEILLLALTLAIISCKVQEHVKVDVDWRNLYLKELELEDIEEDPFHLRIWKNHHQLIDFRITQKNSYKIKLINYIDKVDKKYNKKGVFFDVKNYEGDTLSYFFKEVKAYLPLLLEHKNVQSYSGNTYYFEAMANGEYNFFFIISDLQSDTLKLAELIRFIENDLDINSSYNQFKKELPPGMYYDGKVVLTILKNKK